MPRRALRRPPLPRAGPRRHRGAPRLPRTRRGPSRRRSRRTLRGGHESGIAGGLQVSLLVSPDHDERPPGARVDAAAGAGVALEEIALDGELLEDDLPCFDEAVDEVGLDEVVSLEDPA